MKILLVFLLSAAFVTGCASEPTPPDNPVVVDEPVVPAPTRTVGTGSGSLEVDGKALGIGPGEVVAIAPGSYQRLAFSNLVGTAAQRITLVANGLVEVVGGDLSLTNVAYLTVTGGGVAKNLLIRDNTYRGITIGGRIPQELTLRGIRLRNIADYAIAYANTAAYDGTEETTLTNFRLLNCEFENTGTVMIDGNLNSTGGVVNNGFAKNPEVAYCAFRNCPTTGTLLYIGNTEGCNIHHNVVDQVNAQNDNHNGIFHLKGNGSVHHNKCTNHQGNFVRFWLFSQGNTPKDVLMYNNIVWNSRKYSALEVQAFAETMIPGVSTFANARVYNNTAGKLNTTRPTVYVGVVLDVYNLFGGELTFVNNLSFDQVKTPGNDNIWSQESETAPSLNANNRYYSSAAEAGLVDQTAFRLQQNSPAKGAGMTQANLSDDYYGAKRATPPSIGAVE